MGGSIDPSSRCGVTMRGMDGWMDGWIHTVPCRRHEAPVHTHTRAYLHIIHPQNTHHKVLDGRRRARVLRDGVQVLEWPVHGRLSAWEPARLGWSTRELTEVGSSSSVAERRLACNNKKSYCHRRQGRPKQPAAGPPPIRMPALRACVMPVRAVGFGGSAKKDDRPEKKSTLSVIVPPPGCLTPRSFERE
jgi:hypothetical protein